MANRVLLGNRATGGYGLYVSKTGSNVLTCSDNELIFDSRKSYFGQLLICQEETVAASSSVTRTFNPQGRDCYSQIFGPGPALGAPASNLDLAFVWDYSSTTSSPKVTCELSITNETTATYKIVENHGVTSSTVTVCIWRIDR